MGHLKRNINLVLLITVVLSIGYVLTLTTYYETNFGQVNSKYYEQVENYHKLIGDIKDRERKLNETSYELSKKSKDKEALNKQYVDVVNDKKKTESELSKTKSELIKTNSQLDKVNSDLNTKISELNNIKKSINSIQSSISSEIDDAIKRIASNSNLSKSDVSDYMDDVKSKVNKLDNLK